ncbi:MAG: MATE family efflux transporter [Defluviitaleaceae bacterium]|nr:MATE family efflux transporter [Defluviitaleaceae bacterium]
MNVITTSIKQYMPRLWKISVPIIIEQVFITVMGLVNTAMISTLGDSALSAAGMIDNISNIVIAVFAALTTGGAIVVAQHVGAGDRHGASSAAAQSVVMSLGISLCLFTVFLVFRRQVIYGLFGAAAPDVHTYGNQYFFIINFSYPVLAVIETIFASLRGSGNTRVPMMISLGMNVFNFIFGYIFIIGVNLPFLHTHSLGVAGGACSLLIARALGMCAALFYILKKSTTIRFGGIKFFKPNWKVMKSVLGFGLPTGVESMLFQAGRLITQLFIIGMGTAALAANTVAGNINGFINVPGNSFTTGTMIVIGQMIGEGRASEVKKASFFSVFFGMAIMGVLCVAVYPLIGGLGRLYNLDGDSFRYFSQLLGTCLIVTPFIWPVSFVTPAALRASSDVKYTMVIAVASMWAFRIVVGYILGVHFNLGPVGVWVGMYVDWVVRGVMFVTRFTSGRWRRNAKVHELEGVAE